MRRLVLLGVAACASPDAPFFSRGGVAIENDRSIYMGPARVDLGTSTLALPTHLYVNDVDILQPLDECIESQLGVAMYPVANAVGDTTSATPQPPEIEWRGPVAVRVKIPYDVPYSCGSTTTSLSGTTTLTFFTNGRILRRDEDVVGSRTLLPLDARTCMSCSGTDDPYNLTSFWAFATTELHDDAFERVPFVDNKRACIVVGAVTVGIQYDSVQPYTSGNSGGFTKTVQRLLPQNADMWQGNLPGQASSSSVALSLGSDAAACSDALARLETSKIFLDSEELAFSDGIYRSATVHREPFEITVPQKLTSSFVLDVDLGGATHAKVYVADRLFDAYIVQQVGERTLFDLPAIDKGEVYRIEPL